MNWSILLVVFLLMLGTLWVSNYFLGKKGLCLFTSVSIVLCSVLEVASVFDYPIPIGAVINTFCFFVVIYTCFKHTREDAKKIAIFTICACLLHTFINLTQLLYIDSITWKEALYAISIPFSLALAFLLIIILSSKLKVNNSYLKNGIIGACAILMECIIFSLLANLLYFSFKDALFIMLISLFIKLLAIIILCALQSFIKEKGSQ